MIFFILFLQCNNPTITVWPLWTCSKKIKQPWVRGILGSFSCNYTDLKCQCAQIKKKIKFHKWLTASSYVVKYLRISSYIRKPYLKNDFATDPTWISLHMRKISFSFLSVCLPCRVYCTKFIRTPCFMIEKLLFLFLTHSKVINLFILLFTAFKDPPKPYVVYIIILYCT